MKRQAPSHPKMQEFARLMGIGRPLAVGIMELFWHWVADYAPKGDIGRYTDAQIGAGIGYEGDCERLVSALRDARFVDANDDHRLVVHDWSEHAELSAHTLLARKRWRFIDGKAPSLQGLRGDERPDAKAFYDKKRPRTVLGTSKDNPRTVLGIPTCLSLDGPVATSTSTTTSALASTRASVLNQDAPTRPKPWSEPPGNHGVRWDIKLGWVGIDDGIRAIWKSAYPACDIDRQLAAATAWLLANPAKAHKSSWFRFMTNWLRRSQDHGGDIKSETRNGHNGSGKQTRIAAADARRAEERAGEYTGVRLKPGLVYRPPEGASYQTSPGSTAAPHDGPAH